MNKYLRLFETEQEYETARAEDYEEPWVSLTNKGTAQVPNLVVDYNKTEQEKMLEKPLTFNITSAGNIYWTWTENDGPKTIYYKKNDGDWTSITSVASSYSATPIQVVAGDIVQFKGDNSSYSYYYYDRHEDMYLYSNSTFGESTCGFTVEGNVMSLINSSNPAEATFESESKYNLASLFRGCSGLTDASGLILPAEILTQDCYAHMFYNCTNLTVAPELPATTLASYCYSYMFYHCESLTAMPQLPATTLATSCYTSMFSGCYSLTTSQELPATTLASSCYSYMFQGCTNLVNAPELPATTLATACYINMFYVCTNLETAPILPATTLTTNCYNYMFYGCSKLNYIKAMFTTTPSSSYTNYWVDSVSNTGTFVKNSAATWTTTGKNGVPTGWTVQTADA